VKVVKFCSESLPVVCCSACWTPLEWELELDPDDVFELYLGGVVGGVDGGIVGGLDWATVGVNAT